MFPLALQAVFLVLLLLVFVPLGNAFRLDTHKAREAAHAYLASQTPASALVVPKQTAEAMPTAVRTEIAAEPATEACVTGSSNTPAKPKPEAAKEAATILSRSSQETLINAVRDLRVAEPSLGVKPLVAKLKVQWPGLGADTKQVREAIRVLTAEIEVESEALKTAALPAVEEDFPPDVALSLACFGCGKLPSDINDDREKHPVCPKCRERKLPTTYFCSLNCPAFPDAWKRHMAWHKLEKRQRLWTEDGGWDAQRNREEAERRARYAAQTGSKYDELMAESVQYCSQKDWRRAVKACRQAITLRPDDPRAYFYLASALCSSSHFTEAGKTFFEARERLPLGSPNWAFATAAGFLSLVNHHQPLGDQSLEEVAKLEWWNDEGLKAMSAKVLQATPNARNSDTHHMRAVVLGGTSEAWEVGTRSAAELNEAAVEFDLAATECHAPEAKTHFHRLADWVRRQAEDM